MNKMKEVAQILGVELEEEFYMDNESFYDTGYIAPFKITEEGLFHFDEEGTWQESYYLNELLLGKLSIGKSILNAKEKEYLSAVIKRSKGRINCIYKMETSSQVLINVVSNHENNPYRDLIISIPIFNETAFKGMKLYKEYSLEELGLDKE